MGYFPFFADINNKRIAVIGGGSVACRKVRILTEYGAMLTVTAPDICDEIYRLVEKCGNIIINVQPFSEDVLQGVCAVIAATSDRKVNQHIYELCVKNNIPVNTVDDPDKCTFIFPALVHKGNISVGISSSGTAPAFSAYLRRRIEELMDEKMLFCAEMTAELRPIVRERFSSEKRRRDVMYAVIEYIDSSEMLPDRSEIYKLLEDMEYEDKNRDS